jgi:hypothetical protein
MFFYFCNDDEALKLKFAIEICHRLLRNGTYLSD